MAVKFIIHEGNVVSKNDGDLHFISGNRLIRLYELDPKECFIVHEGIESSCTNYNLPTYEHIYPRYDGNYPLFNQNSGSD